MASPDRQRNALQIIFSFFLGLMVLAFIGIGVNTFYPQPKTYDAQLEKLYREQGRISNKSGAQDAEIKRLDEQIQVIQKKQEAERQIWARNSSIVLILFATFVMAVSLIRAEQLPVISNGLLLGGLFTMVYGVGWVLFSGESVARFYVILFALAVTLGLGYVKFVRGRQEGAAETATVAPVDLSDAHVASLVARVDALERRAAAAAAVLGGAEPPDRPA